MCVICGYNENAVKDKETGIYFFISLQKNILQINKKVLQSKKINGRIFIE